MKKTIVYHAKKHMSLITCMLVASGIICMGVITYLIVSPAKGVGPTAVSKTVTAPHAIVSNRYSIDYPVLDSDKVDAALKNYASGQVASFVERLGEDKYDPRNRMTLDYSLLHHGKQFVTIIFTQREYTVNNPMIESRVIQSFDLKRQTKLAAADLFVSSDEAQSFLGILLYDYFKQYAASDFSQEQFAKLLQFKLSNIHDFIIGKDTLTFFINPKQLDSDTDIQTVVISKSILKDVLKPGYDSADEGTDIDYVASYAISQRPKPADEIDPNKKMLALTFDDGPGNYTNRVLDTLRQNRSHGTFFVIGRQVPGRADIVKRVANEGNEIGNHSWDHAFLPALSHDELAYQIDATQRAIQQATNGYIPTLMRPPYGAANDAVAGYLQQKQLKVALWNVDTEDWLYPDAQAMYDRIMQSAADGSIILLHDIHPSSVEAIERAIPDLIGQGYQLVTMSQLEQHR